MTIGLEINMRLEMPAISTRALPRNIARYVEEGYREANTGTRLGIEEERNTGVVPIHIDRKPDYAGVTEFERVIKGNTHDVEAVRIGISDSIPTHVMRGNKVIPYVKRVTGHEVNHMLSEKLLRYMDVTPHQRTLIMESYAEFRDIRKGKRDDVLLTTPYPGAIKFAYFVDRFYESERDGNTGYAAFIRDIQRYKSARTALENLGRNIRAAINRGVDVVGMTEREYRSELIAAHRNAGIAPRYARSAYSTAA